MTSGTTELSPVTTDLDPSGSGRSRDAATTRQLLLDAARRRFARDGYSATTVRDIAGDAGVNVALINRYFTSKEGLFEACLRHVAEEFTRTAGETVTVELAFKRIIQQVTESPSGEYPLQLLLLLRSSGDEGADRIRRNTLQYFAERMAAAAGWTGDDPSTHPLILRAQIAMGAALGLMMLRSSTGIEPLTSAGEGELSAPVGDLLAALLSH